MTQHKRRMLTRVIELRQRELDQRAEGLSRARAEAKAAEEAAARAEREARNAVETRNQLFSGGADAATWAAVGEWVLDRDQRHEGARGCVRRAETATQKAQAAVMAAHTDLRRIETVLDRLSSEDARLEARAERRAADEHAARTPRRKNTP